MIVTVLVDGKPVVGSLPAVVESGAVTAPLDPYALAIARRMGFDPATGRITFERDGKTFTIILGSGLARLSRSAEALPIAPYLRDGQPIIPLAALARALGAGVSYDAPAHLLAIRLPPPPPVATMSPFAGPFPASPAPAASEAPTPSPPHVLPSRNPAPRRTPILIDSSAGAAADAAVVGKGAA